MDESIKVAISSDFLSSFAALPRQVQKKVTEFINKFKTNSKSSGINLEKIKDGTDKNMCSVRIDNTYRGILVRPEESNVYLLLWVDHHDEAYEWARRKRCEINKRTGSIQIFDVKDIPETQAADNSTGIFDAITDEELLSLGVPESLCDFIRSLKTQESFNENIASLPHDIAEPLSWIADGADISEVIDAYAENKTETIPDNISDALKSPLNMQSFVVIDGEDELKRIMSAPLEKWRIFLHPTQRKIVNKNYNGSVRILGGAGTGKTVVAMHRAKYLASGLNDNDRILFTTFTANLASDIRENLEKICTIDEMRKIEVINLDAWVTRFLREQGYKYKIIYGDEISQLLEKAVNISDNGLDLPVSFYEEEWLKVITAQEAFSVENYIKASRTGRGTRLDRKKRIQVWKVFENFLKLMKQEHVRDINYAMYECQLILSLSSYETNYKYIIVDEGQDFSSSAYSMIRKISGTEHENDIFIVGDAHQRIYRNTATLSKCGINIKGRSRKLKINYRTTDEIHKYAFSILKGISFDDLDGETDSSNRCKSLTHGQIPTVSSFKDIGQEINYVISEIDKLLETGAALSDICVVSRTHRLLDIYTNEFTKAGIRCYEIKNTNTDNRTLDGLRLATMHRVKGLEFKYVFLVSAIEDIIPLKSAINHTDFVTEQDTVTSEKCLMYVALTRAQKQAYITGYGKMTEFLG